MSTLDLQRSTVTAGRVLAQLRGDHRTVALMLVVPCVLNGLVAWIFEGTPVFDRIGPDLVGIFPMVVMFIVTSIATLRERQSGTLERLLTTPLAKGDFMLGYALAFGGVVVLQSVLVTGLSVTVFGLDVAGPLGLLLLIALLAGLLGTSLGLLASGFARTEFQAVQFMPAFVLPQFLLCGLLTPREDMPAPLALLSDVLPLSYIVDATHHVATDPTPWPDTWAPLLVIVGFIVAALALGSATLRRRTP
jgi:ABC-2 type transport system permease protein